MITNNLFGNLNIALDVNSLNNRTRAQIRLLALISKISATHLGVVTILRSIYRKQCNNAIRNLKQFHQVPKYLREDGVDDYYRPENHSISQSLLSVLYFHNESFNIHSHFIASIFHLVLLFRRLFRYYKKGTGVKLKRSDQSGVLILYLAGVTFVFGVSTVAHTFGSYSEEIHKKLFAMDHLAIFISCVVNIISTGALEFNEKWWVRFVFNSSAFMLFCITYGLLHYVKIEDKQNKQKARVLSLIALGILGLMPITSQCYYAYIYGHNNLLKRVIFYTLSTFSPILIGALTYAFHFPERYFAKNSKMKFIGNNGITGHGLMHVFVAIGLWQGYLGLKTWNRYLPNELKNLDLYA